MLATFVVISLLQSQATAISPIREYKLEKNKKIWLMFFMKSDGERPKDESILEKMQSDHIANLDSQWKKSNLLIAGPLNDPTKERRGITVAIARNRTEIDTFFTTDPFVQNRLMSVAAWEWEVSISKFQIPSDPTAMGEYRIVLCKRRLSNAERTKLRSVAVGGQLNLRQPERKNAPTEAYLVDSLKESAATACLNTQSEIEFVPLWMSKGVLKP